MNLEPGPGSTVWTQPGGLLSTFASLAFALCSFTAALLTTYAAPRCGTYVVRSGTSSAFAIAQLSKGRARLAEALQDGLSAHPFSESLVNYFVRSSFDLCDIAAALSSGLAAGVARRLMLLQPGVIHAT